MATPQMEASSALSTQSVCCCLVVVAFGWQDVAQHLAAAVQLAHLKRPCRDRSPLAAGVGGRGCMDHLLRPRGRSRHVSGWGGVGRAAALSASCPHATSQPLVLIPSVKPLVPVPPASLLSSYHLCSQLPPCHMCSHLSPCHLCSHLSPCHLCSHLSSRFQLHC